MSLEWYIGSEWSKQSKGLHKRVLQVDFSQMKKPAMISKSIIRVLKVEHLNGRESEYLSFENMEKQQILEMGVARTPIDCYVEILVQQMLVGETACCRISTKVSQTDLEEAIIFEIKLEIIQESRDFHTLEPKEIYEKALQFKENGVVMFKKYPLFAQEYFTRAAKFLISLKPFKGLKKEQDGVDGELFTELLLLLQTNLAACLLPHKRYEDVIYHTQFVESALSEVNEKAIYRRAAAYYYLKEYELAQQLIEERVKNYKEHKEFGKLYRQVLQDSKTSQAEYKTVVQRMFN